MRDNNPAEGVSGAFTLVDDSVLAGATVTTPFPATTPVRATTTTIAMTRASAVTTGGSGGVEIATSPESIPQSVPATPRATLAPVDLLLVISAAGFAVILSRRENH